MKNKAYELNFYAWWVALHMFNVGPKCLFSLILFVSLTQFVTHSLTASQHSFPQQNSLAHTLTLSQHSHSGSKSTSQVMFYKFVLELCYLFTE